MIENLIAGTILIALGALGVWHFSPASIETLASTGVGGLGAWRILNAFQA